MNLDDETRQKLGAYLAEKRNLCQREAEITDEFLNYLGTPFQEAVGVKEEPEKAAVSEENFALNYTEYTSQKLGTFEVTEEKGNIPEKWNRAYNILKQANATISNRYHGPNYAFAFWLYNKKIYRQKIK